MEAEEAVYPRPDLAAGATTDRRSLLAVALLIGAIVLIAINLRPAITSVGPIIGEIRTATGISGVAAGLLTTLPVIGFALLSPVATRLGTRFGIEPVLLAGSLLLAAGIALRSGPTLFALYAGTAVLGGAIALGNVLLPALVKRDFPSQAGMLTAIYASAVSIGAGLGAGLSAPLADRLDLGWRLALAAWAVPALIAALAWMPQLRARHRPERARLAIDSLLRVPLAWQVTLFFGLQSFGFYASVAWLPSIIIDGGLDVETAGWMVSLAHLGGLASTLAVPPLAERRPSQTAFVVITAALLLAGFGGLLLAGGDAVPMWTILIGMGQGAGLGLGLLFCVLRAPDPRTAAELSGMAQAVGYLIAATAPALAGLVHDVTGGWTTTLLLLIAAAIGQLAFGLGAARAGHVRAPVHP